MTRKLISLVLCVILFLSFASCSQPAEEGGTGLPSEEALAKAELPRRTAYFAKIMGVTPKSVKITSAKKRFGSCSGQNGICYSWRLMLYPSEAIDYVVVHELAHIRQKNHSPAFYREIEKILPDYKARAKLLKDK